MDKALQDQLAQYLKQIADAAQKGADFATSQAPLVVQEKILSARISETLTLVVLAGVIALAVYLFRYGYHNRCTSHSVMLGADERNGGLMILTGFWGGVASLLFLIELTTVVEVWFAPRLYIVEWIMGGMK